MGYRFCTPSCVALAMRFALLGLATAGAATHAQLVPSTSAASAPGSAEDPMERAKRQADNVMRWIKVHADKPRAAPTGTTSAPTPPAPPATRPLVSKAVPPMQPPGSRTAEAAAPPPIEIPAPPAAAIPSLVLPEPVLATPATPLPAPPPPQVDLEDDTPLKALAQEQPNIPRNVLAALSSPGKVMVQFRVETNGSVSNVQVLSSSRAQLNKPTIAAVNNWRFEPIKIARVAQIEFAFMP